MSMPEFKDRGHFQVCIATRRDRDDIVSKDQLGAAAVVADLGIKIETGITRGAGIGKSAEADLCADKESLAGISPDAKEEGDETDIGRRKSAETGNIDRFAEVLGVPGGGYAGYIPGQTPLSLQLESKTSAPSIREITRRKIEIKTAADRKWVLRLGEGGDAEYRADGCDKEEFFHKQVIELIVRINNGSNIRVILPDEKDSRNRPADGRSL